MASRSILLNGKMKTIGRNTYKMLLMQDARQRHQLINVAVEILDSCVYKCPHCYVRNQYKSIMHIEDYHRVINQIAECGCKMLLLTGGEPLMHPQFVEMYKYAYKKGFRITVFTNGYLVNRQILNCFKEFPPELVELTIYGGTKKSYDEYVQVQGAFDVFDESINRLKRIGINTKAKCVLMPGILDEFSEISEYMKSKEIEFRYDGFVVPRINGDIRPCEEYRLPPKIVFEMDMKKRGFIDAQIEKRRQFECKNDINNLYFCDAAYCSVFIDASCKMSICTFARHISIELNDNCSVKEGQKKLIQMIEAKEPLGKSDECYNCKNKAFCRYCPGQFLIENGDEYKPIHWHCQYAKFVASAIEERYRNNEYNSY